MNDLRILRDRQRSGQAGFDTSLGDLSPFGSAAILGLTFQENAYPTNASQLFAFHPVEFDGDETEGASATPVADTETTFYAYNLGGEIPPEGTKIVCHAVGGRWVFRYDRRLRGLEVTRHETPSNTLTVKVASGDFLDDP